MITNEQILNFQLKEKGYTNIDALDGSEGMLEKAKQKGVYKNCIKAMIGNAPIEGIEKGIEYILCFRYYNAFSHKSKFLEHRSR